MKTSRRQFISRCVLGAAATGTSPLAPLAAREPRPLFDGQTLSGWHAEPRLTIPPNDQRFATVPSGQLRQAVHDAFAANPQTARRVKNRGVWKVEDHAILGGQLPGTEAGAYLISDDTFGDFELTLEARPDFPIDTGVMVRAHALGSIGFQVLVDHRKNGVIGGIFGNSIGNFRAYPFVVDGDEEPGFRVTKIRPGIADGPNWKPDFAATFEDFQQAWRPNAWNSLRIRCIGELPLIETWINDTPIAKLDTAKLADRVPGYDPQAILERIGRRGHIAFEVHDNGKSGRNRWAPGAVCRWRNIRIVEF
jgi:hypothetical protein